MPTQVRLPDELWSQILGNLTYKDLCSVSITCKRLHRISCEDSLWSRLLSSDFVVPLLPELFMKANYCYRLARKGKLIEANRRRGLGKRERDELNELMKIEMRQRRNMYMPLRLGYRGWSAGKPKLLRY